MQRKKLPIGIQTFREIREENYYYVDKTSFALRLIAQGKYYFLSRPRRFGKSLFLDTLKALFEGHKNLFAGLHAENHWDWSTVYPVIRLSLGAGVVKDLFAFQELVGQQMHKLEQESGFQPQFQHNGRRLQDLIQHLQAKSGKRVVVLIDEYDKPILDNLSQPDIALEMRDALRDLYAVLKDQDAYLKFVLITGVSKFSKVNLFSGFNNLRDITLSSDHAAICGYTDEDVDHVFAPELPGLNREEIRAWYNGYNWRGTPVYNPFDVLLLFQEREFRAYWFETGTPTFLVDLLAGNKWFTPDMLQLEANDNILSSFEVGSIAPEALLWQTGYLTIQAVQEPLRGHRVYLLGYPNREVEMALNESLLKAYGPEPRPALVARSHLSRAIQNHDMKALEQSFHALFASIPYEWYRKNPLADFEGHYASVFYSQLAALGLNVQPEDITNKGRIDLSLKLDNTIYLFEFKVVNDQATGEALQQLIDKAYADKYRTIGTNVMLVGIEFSKAERNIVGFETQRITN